MAVDVIAFQVSRRSSNAFFEALAVYRLKGCSWALVDVLLVRLN